MVSKSTNSCYAFISITGTQKMLKVIYCHSLAFIIGMFSFFFCSLPALVSWWYCVYSPNLWKYYFLYMAALTSPPSRITVSDFFLQMKYSAPNVIKFADDWLKIKSVCLFNVHVLAVGVDNSQPAEPVNHTHTHTHELRPPNTQYYVLFQCSITSKQFSCPEYILHLLCAGDRSNHTTPLGLNR